MDKCKKCKKCKFYIYSITLGSLDKPVWHCRYGFSPTKDCKRLGEYNEEIVNNGLLEHMRSPRKK